jgi:tetratricopeptide (TPR) repeat protein
MKAPWILILSSLVLFVSSIRAEKSSALKWYNAGSAYYNAGKFVEAANAFYNVIKSNSPLRPAATLGLSKCRRRLLQFDKAFAIDKFLQQQANPYLASALKDEFIQLWEAAKEQGTAWYQAREYSKAVSALDVVSQIAPTGEILLMKGMALMQLGRTADAQSVFREAYLLSSDPETKGNTKFFSDKLESRMGLNRLSVFMDFGLGYNSNIYLEGTDYTSAPTSQLFVVPRYLLYDHYPWTGSAAYLFYWEEAIGEQPGRFLSQSFQGQAHYQDGGWSFRLTPQLQYQILGTDPFLFKGSLTLQGQRAFDPYYTGVLYEMAKGYGQPSYEYLNGSSHSLKIYLGHLAEKVDLSAFYSFNIENIGDLSSTGTTLPLNHFGHGPGIRFIWEPAPLWEMNSSFSYLSRHYKNKGQPGDLERSDSVYSVSARLSYGILQNCRFFGSLNWLVNRSTLNASSGIDDKNYSQLIVLTGIAWDALN